MPPNENANAFIGHARQTGLASVVEPPESGKDLMTSKSVPHSKVKIEPVTWLWPGRIPIGQITLIAGQTGVGKSVIINDVIARVSTGAERPDGAGPTPEGGVLVFGEDSVGQVQNPRLLAARADLRRIRHWKNDGPAFYLDHHLADLTADLRAHPGTKLVVLDPLPDYIIASSYAGVRQVMGALRDLVREQGIAVIGIGHPAKGLPAPKDSFGGSRGFPTLARAFWQVVQDEDGRQFMLWVKGNLSGLRTGLEFESPVRQVGRQRIEVPYASWIDEPVEMTAQDWWMLEKSRREEKPTKSAKIQATLFLQEFLRDGSKLADEVLEEVKRREIKRGSLHRAKEALGVKVMKQTGVKHGPWVWSLPAEKQPEPEAAPSQSGSNVVPFQKPSSSE
jgi:putative DNA primase/helicase